MGNSFKLIASNKWLEIVSEFAIEGLKQYGYDETMHLNRPDNPEIWEFQKEGNVLSMTIAPLEGDLSDQSEIIVETEQEGAEEEIFGAIGRGIALMMKHFSYKVFEAVESKKAKLAVISEISKNLEDLKKKI